MKLWTGKLQIDLVDYWDELLRDFLENVTEKVRHCRTGWLSGGRRYSCILGGGDSNISSSVSSNYSHTNPIVTDHR